MSPADERAHPAPDGDERTRLGAALERLHAVLTDVAAAVTARVDERCPYRARDERCTFAGGCVNQRREAPRDAEATRIVRCGGDHQLRRTKA